MFKDSPLAHSGRLLCAFSRRTYGNMSLSYGNTTDSLANRAAFLNPLGINYQDLVCAKQIHSDSVAHITESDRGKGALSYDGSVADTDAFITGEKFLPLAIFTADCLSIFVYDPIASAIGLIHAGWRSSKEDITMKTIQEMQARFNTKPINLYVGFGPAIKSCCYAVGEDFKNHFSEGIVKRQGRLFLDLIKINRLQLEGLGVKETSIFDSHLCTCCNNDELFSFRKDGETCGRMISVIMLK